MTDRDRQERPSSRRSTALSGRSIFGSPEPDRTPSEFRYQGPRTLTQLEQKLLNKKPGTSFSYNPRDLRAGPRDTGYHGDREARDYRSEVGHRDTSPMSSRGWVSEGDLTRMEEFDLTPTANSTHFQCPPTIHPTNSPPCTRIAMETGEPRMRDKLQAYEERYLRSSRDPSREVRLPSYDRALQETFQRSYHRQSIIAQGSLDVPLRTVNRWDLFPTVEDIQTTHLVQSQYEEAINPDSDFPDIGDWMGLYVGEDGVYSLNTALSRMPITGKRAVYSRKAGVKLLVMFRPAVLPLGAEKGKSRKRSHIEFGFRFVVMDGGVYVSYIHEGSAAVRAGLKYGDQILRVNTTYCTGLLVGQIEDLLRYEKVTLLVRDRPNMKLYTLLTDSQNRFGIRISDSEIVEVVEGTSAWRNGVPTNHYIVEINNQNVVGWSDTQLRTRMAEAAAEGVVTFALLHDRAYTDSLKDIGANLLKTMDHSLDFTISLPYFNLDNISWNPSSVFGTKSKYQNNAIKNT